MWIAAVGVVVRTLLLDDEYRFAKLHSGVEIFRLQLAESRPLPEKTGLSGRYGDVIRHGSCACLTHILPIILTVEPVLIRIN